MLQSGSVSRSGSTTLNMDYYLLCILIGPLSILHHLDYAETRQIGEGRGEGQGLGPKGGCFNFQI